MRSHALIVTSIFVMSLAARGDVKHDYDEKAVTALMRTNADESVAKGVAEAKRLMARGGPQGDYACISARYRWVEALVDVGRHPEAIALCEAGIRRLPNATTHVEAFQRHRVKCLLALGRSEEALGHAKLYYNVCTMRSAADAMTLIVDCLRAARPDRPELVRRFMEEQVAGSTVTRDAPAAGRTSVLEGIEIPADARKEYSARADARLNAPPGELAGRLTLGNYLLLADRCAEAREVFAESYPLIDGGYWFKDATEAVARALKAEDGAIGRANAWVLAQR
jgi:hypothetical protein